MASRKPLSVQYTAINNIIAIQRNKLLSLAESLIRNNPEFDFSRIDLLINGSMIDYIESNDIIWLFNTRGGNKTLLELSISDLLRLTGGMIANGLKIN